MRRRRTWELLLSSLALLGGVVLVVSETHFSPAVAEDQSRTAAWEAAQGDACHNTRGQISHFSRSRIPSWQQDGKPINVYRLEVNKLGVESVRRLFDRDGWSAEGSVSLRFLATPRQSPEPVVATLDSGPYLGAAGMLTGDAEVFPVLARQTPIPLSQEERVLAAADDLKRSVLYTTNFLEADDGEVAIAKRKPIYCSTKEAGAATSTDPSICLTYTQIRRSMEGLPVYGPGSRATLIFGTDGNLQGVVRHWKTARQDHVVNEDPQSQRTEERITRQLEEQAVGANVDVIAIEKVYYDDNETFLRPAYRITARLIPTSAPIETTDRSRLFPSLFHDVAVYVFLGDDRGPAEAQSPNLETPGTSVGRYVIRCDSRFWLESARLFGDSLKFGSATTHFRDSQFDTQANSKMYDTEANRYVDSVSVALTEGHGTWWRFSTKGLDGDAVSIGPSCQEAGGPACGYGRERLRYWILHSCAVIPSPNDIPCKYGGPKMGWWDPWFQVFRGLHSVVGYRTIMMINDKVAPSVGSSLDYDLPLVPAWLFGVIGSNEYRNDVDDTTPCTDQADSSKPIPRPRGRASTISVCGHQDDRTSNIDRVADAPCLISYWQPDH